MSGRRRGTQPGRGARSAGTAVVVLVVASICLGVLVWAGSRGTAPDEYVARVVPPVTTSSSSAPSETAGPPKRQRIVAGVTFVRAPDPAKRARARELRRMAELAALADQPFTFRVSSFNILGHGHTTASGNKPGYADGPQRMRWAIDIMNGAGISVAGLQEYEVPQHEVLVSTPGWEVFPGLQLGKPALANSIVWRSEVWELVEGHTIDIPYFGGEPKPMPYALLRHRDSGRETWFANFHNPASTRGPAGHLRAEATRRETELAARLTADGTPLVLTGDMNDKAEFFCTMTRGAPMRAANGGSTGSSCSLPPDPRIDWIMGSLNITFSDYAADRGGLVPRTTDHPFVHATATVG